MRTLTNLADIGVEVHFDKTAANDGATWDPLERRLTIDHRLDIEDVTFVLKDYWNHLTIGECASSATPDTTPILVLIPSPREHSETPA